MNATEVIEKAPKPMSSIDAILDARGLRAPFGWPVLRIDPGAGVRLSWAVPPLPVPAGGWLRVAVSVDDREEKTVTARLASSGKMLGVFDLKYCHSLAPFQIRLTPDNYAAAAQEGVILSLDSATTPLWLLGHPLPDGAEALGPHLVPDAPADIVRVFLDRLGSLASVQTFGWMEGCVLDALHDLHIHTGDVRWRRAMDEHLSLFITAGDRLIYEDPRGRPADGRIYGIEGTLPFAPLAKVSPDHSLLSLVLNFYRERLNADGTFTHPESCTAEGSYTIAYPLAVIAEQRRDTALASLAANVLRVRRDQLRRPDGLWLRHHLDGSRTFRSWARGVAWYLLGLGRSLEHLGGLIDTTDLQADFRDAATWACKWQRPDGLWSCYLDDNATLYDTSGSAGIAAALARGVRFGLLDASHLAAAQNCWRGSLPHLTPDGFLDGAAQSNRGGEPLQRGPYRVLSPVGMGLLGQLFAALGPQNG